jgi:hypothetical protein
VCFSLPSGLRAIVSEIIGGMTQTTVKKENGARLDTPLLLNVDAQPIGRGTTAQAPCFTARRPLLRPEAPITIRMTKRGFDL